VTRPLILITKSTRCSLPICLLISTKCRGVVSRHRHHRRNTVQTIAAAAPTICNHGGNTLIPRSACATTKRASPGPGEARVLGAGSAGVVGAPGTSRAASISGSRLGVRLGGVRARLGGVQKHEHAPAFLDVLEGSACKPASDRLRASPLHLRRIRDGKPFG